MKSIITQELKKTGYADGDDALTQMTLLQKLFG